MAQIFGESIFNSDVSIFGNQNISNNLTIGSLSVSNGVISATSGTASFYGNFYGSFTGNVNLTANLTVPSLLVSGITTLGTTFIAGGIISGVSTAGITTITSPNLIGVSTISSSGIGTINFTNSSGIGSMVLNPALNRFTVNNAGFYINANTNSLDLTAAGFNLSFDGINVIPTNKTKVTFTFSASDQSWVVPVGVSYIYAKLWGSGGGGGHFGGWSFGSWGGGGGHTRGIIPVTAGETLTIRVPRGGYANPGSTNAPFGGGSSTGGGDNQYAAGGGGYCGIFRSSTPLLIAGAGGGGGSVNGSHAMCNGGAGGGLNGLRGESRDGATSFAGGGGTQSAGGTAGNGANTGGGAGSSLQGGSVQGSVYGGGGGGGYYGGGSGSYGSGNTMAGGGGGSGYVISTAILASTFSGKGAYPAGMDDVDYPASTASTYSSVGYGGVQRNNGGDGYLVIYY